MKPAGMPDSQWQTAVNYGSIYGVPPEFLAAIAQHETGFGTLGWGRPSQGEYILGYGAYSDTRADSKYSGADNQFRYAARQIGNFFGGKSYNEGTIQDFARQSWRPGNPDAWASSVNKIFQGLTGGGDVVGLPPTGPVSDGGSRGSGSLSVNSGTDFMGLGAVALGVVVALVLVFTFGLSGVVKS